MIIDAIGKPCPMPLVLAKKEIDAGTHEFTIKVDNETAVKNLSRLATKRGLALDVLPIEGGYELTFAEGSSSTQALDLSTIFAATPTAQHAHTTQSGYAVFVSKDVIGEGERELGYNLMKMALYTFAEIDAVPSSLLFMNSGVTLLTSGEQQIIESVEKLAEKGTEVLVCGTCLDYYGLKNKLQIGEVSNMYDILERMEEAAKVITL